MVKPYSYHGEAPQTPEFTQGALPPGSPAARQLPLRPLCTLGATPRKHSASCKAAIPSFYSSNFLSNAIGIMSGDQFSTPVMTIFINVNILDKSDSPHPHPLLWLIRWKRSTLFPE